MPSRRRDPQQGRSLCGPSCRPPALSSRDDGGVILKGVWGGGSYATGKALEAVCHDDDFAMFRFKVRSCLLEVDFRSGRDFRESVTVRITGVSWILRIGAFFVGLNTHMPEGVSA